MIKKILFVTTLSLLIVTSLSAQQISYNKCLKCANNIHRGGIEKKVAETVCHKESDDEGETWKSCDKSISIWLQTCEHNNLENIRIKVGGDNFDFYSTTNYKIENHSKYDEDYDLLFGLDYVQDDIFRLFYIRTSVQLGDEYEIALSELIVGINYFDQRHYRIKDISFVRNYNEMCIDLCKKGFLIDKTKR